MNALNRGSGPTIIASTGRGRGDLKHIAPRWQQLRELEPAFGREALLARGGAHQEIAGNVAMFCAPRQMLAAARTFSDAL